MRFFRVTQVLEVADELDLWRLQRQRSRRDRSILDEPGDVPASKVGSGLRSHSREKPVDWPPAACRISNRSVFRARTKRAVDVGDFLSLLVDSYPLIQPERPLGIELTRRKSVLTMQTGPAFGSLPPRRLHTGFQTFLNGAPNHPPMEMRRQQAHLQRGFSMIPLLATKRTVFRRMFQRHLPCNKN